MLNITEATQKVEAELGKDNEIRQKIRKICPENFGWIFLLERIFPDDIVAGGPDGYLVDKKLNKIEPINQRYINDIIKHYQRENNYSEGLRDVKVYVLPPSPEPVIKKICRKIENWLWVR